MDVTDMVDYNMESINRHDLEHSFFQMVKDDPMVGFPFDARTVAGHTIPKHVGKRVERNEDVDTLTLRLRLGSHLALHMRHELEKHKGYTSTVGIATNKLLSKLVGKLNKPKGQTTLMPDDEGGLDSTVTSFMDSHEIGTVPGIGFKLAQRLREFVLQRPADFDFAYGGTKENVTVADVRNHPEIDYENLEKLLGGPGSPHGIGYKVWCLLHGVDETEVSQARAVPRQISIEDSYVRLDTMPELLKELKALARSLINRMRIDLLTTEDDFDDNTVANEDSTPPKSLAGMKWLAHPKTLRLSTRPRLPMKSDGSRERTMKRMSHSCPLPNFVFILSESSDVLAEKLVKETLFTMFRKLHPEKTWWNLSLINIAVTNMAEAAGDSKTANGRDIGGMFKRQEDVLKDFRVTDFGGPEPRIDDELAEESIERAADVAGSKNQTGHDDEDDEEGWIDEDSSGPNMDFCTTCRSAIPSFAMVAHQRFHTPDVP
jgi:DNA polymerase iota